ncbi:hypothetical protein GLOIN_2v1848977 [Rhizophagus clarus]|uniref:C2H2-type domain-containing protein n=1 Tax=Rhizophagus clarus TaxID=94130 RepID=A0A8H3LEN6_9GLOM|nr:hypothetical protein GLOIN_2v1848977 [Rhizophagus clarus]
MSYIVDFPSTSAKNGSFTQASATQMEFSKNYVYISNKLIADINKKVAEEKRLKGPDQNVVKFSLPQLDPKVHFYVLDSIYTEFKADRIDDDLYIKFGSGEKESVHTELQDLLREQLPGWWSRRTAACVVRGNEYYPDIGSWQNEPSQKQQRFPIAFNCPPPQIMLDLHFHLKVAYNVTNDRERALRKIRSNKFYCRETEFIVIVIPHSMRPHHKNPSPESDSEEVGMPLGSRPSKAPYIGYWSSRATFEAVSWHDIVWNKHLSIGYDVRIYFNDILKCLTEHDEKNDDENPRPCPYCEEIIPNPEEMVRHLRENHCNDGDYDDDEY